MHLQWQFNAQAAQPWRWRSGADTWSGQWLARRLCEAGRYAPVAYRRFDEAGRTWLYESRPQR